MKRKIKIIFTVFFTSILSLSLFSCLSLLGDSWRINPGIEISFKGTMDTRYGYESIAWGTRRYSIPNEYKLVSRDSYCILGEGFYSDGEYYIRRFSHDIVNETYFYFENERLFRVIEYLKEKNPSFETLHARYGKFSEVNIATEKEKSKGKRVYSDLGLDENSKLSSIYIIIDANGSTRVEIENNLFELSKVTFPKYSMKDSNYNNIKDEYKILPHTWYIYPSVDSKNERYNYAFITHTKFDRAIIIIYSKDPKSPARSLVRAGFFWEGQFNSQGEYEIKTAEEIKSYKFDSSENYSLLYRDLNYYYSKNKDQSARNLVDIILNNEKLTVRHRNEIEVFNTKGLTKYLDIFNISVEEIYDAISNEEF